MAGIDPYSPCPCGSGEKFKWCCQKVESFAERADRLYEGGQFGSAIGTLDEGLRKNPDNPLLLMNRAIYQIRENHAADGADTLRRLLSVHPNHLGARILLARAVIQTEGPTSSSAHIQNALGLAEGTSRRRLAALYRMVGYVFGRTGQFAAAIKHLDQAEVLDPEGHEDEGEDVDTSAPIVANPAVPPPLKTNYVLSKTPERLSGDLAARFDDALSWAEAGAWNSAAAGFETLSADGAGPEADRNLALLRLWTGDDAGAAQALRRVVAALGDSTKAVDLEMLRQLIERPAPEDEIERVQLIWPLKNRDALLEKLRSAPDVVDDGPGPIDSEDPKSPEVQFFLLLDRPMPKKGEGEKFNLAEVPRVAATAFVGREIAGIETVDDGKLNVHIDRFTSLAVPAIPPSHPKTKSVGRVHRLSIALGSELHLPEETNPAEALRLRDEDQARVLRDVWPKTKIRTLGNRTPVEAARAGDCGVQLRAMLDVLECQTDDSTAKIDIGELRSKLGVPPEPQVDPATLDLETLPYFRYRFVPVDKLDDDRLAEFYAKAKLAGLRNDVHRAALLLADKPELRAAKGFSSMSVFGDLASRDAGLGRRDEALAWVAKGREADQIRPGTMTAAAWDMFEIRILAQVDAPEAWVPELAAVLERYGKIREADQAIVLGLVSMGLMRLVPNPDRPDQILMDSRPLQMVLAEYGPKITTASGRLGVSAARPDLWTPESEARGSTTPGGIWTPGSAGSQGQGGDKPKLIIPGR